MPTPSRGAPSILRPLLLGAVSTLVLAMTSTTGCSSARRLDPNFAGEKYRAVMKFQYVPGETDPALLKEIEPGDVIAFSTDDPSSGSWVAFRIALSQVSHVAIVFPMGTKLRVLSADSERGVYIDTIEACVRDRIFYVFSFPRGLLDSSRLNQFANRAVFLGRLDYDWSAIFAMPTNLTPNTIPEVGDEYTCAGAVAAALHFSGLSLDRGHSGVVTPGDIIFSHARRNLNGPAGPGRPGGNRPSRESEVWEDLR